MAIRGDYLKSPTGIIHILECMFSMLAFICCAASDWPVDSHGAYNFFNFVMMSTFWVTLIFFCVFLLGIVDAMTSINWHFIDFCDQTLTLFFLIIAAPLEAARASGIGGHKAAAVFAFFTLAVFILGAYSTFVQWRRGPDNAPQITDDTGGTIGSKPPAYDAGGEFGAY